MRLAMNYWEEFDVGRGSVKIGQIDRVSACAGPHSDQHEFVSSLAQASRRYKIRDRTSWVTFPGGGVIKDLAGE